MARRRGTEGFTLVEVLAALSILGGALFILLNTHYSALRLHEEMAASVERRQLLERVVSEAEFKVLSGTLTESGEFEGRYRGYSWSFNGKPTGGTEETPIPFYQVEATLRTPEGEEESLMFYVYNVSSNEVLAEGATSSASTSTGNSRSNSTGRSNSTSNRGGGVE